MIYVKSRDRMAYKVEQSNLNWLYASLDYSVPFYILRIFHFTNWQSDSESNVSVCYFGQKKFGKPS